MSTREPRPPREPRTYGDRVSSKPITDSSSQSGLDPSSGSPIEQAVEATIYELLPNKLSATDSKVAAFGATGLTAGAGAIAIMHGFGFGFSGFIESLITLAVTVLVGFAGGFLKKRKKADVLSGKE